MHKFHQVFHIFLWCIRQNAMAKIENVSRPTGSFLQYSFCLRSYLIWLSKQNGRIKIALNGNIIAQSLPCRCQTYAPVNSNHIATSLTHQLQ